MNTNAIIINATINAPVEKVWKTYITPEDIMQWNNASADWHTTKAENDLRIGGKFKFRMEAKDGSAGFDFWGTYDEVKTHELIAYTMGDGRKAIITFTPKEDKTEMAIHFDPENENSVEMQRSGWQGILNNFKKYVEALG